PLPGQAQRDPSVQLLQRDPSVQLLQRDPSVQLLRSGAAMGEADHRAEGTPSAAGREVTVGGRQSSHTAGNRPDRPAGAGPPPPGGPPTRPPATRSSPAVVKGWRSPTRMGHPSRSSKSPSLTPSRNAVISSVV